MKIVELISLVDFLHEFANIKRTVKIKDRNDFENDAEHSYLLSVSCWYIAEKLNLNINRQKLLEYALAHDLVEAYAGDTDPYKSTAHHVDTKVDREKDALVKIKKQFSDFHSLHKAIEDYEHLRDTESQLVYLTDKILPVINTYIANDSYYKDNEISFDRWKQWFESKKEKVTIKEQDFVELIHQLVDFIGTRKKMFHS